ncbi:MAG: PLP-dependent aminotransferase family protein, partial [Clostridia bacterium]|nr:PLP-dependent aminotransferase family protein [Clostridia bacterium]
NFPYALWRKLLRQSFDEIDPLLLKSPDSQGDLALRNSICTYLSQSRNIDAHPEHLIIGNSTAALLRCICGMLGDTHVLASENPVYNTAYSIFSAMGGNCVSIDADRPDRLVENLGRTDADIFYVTPSHQFPLGYSLPLATRIDLLNWAAKDGRYIIEDDYDSEFRYSSKPLLPIKSMDKYEKVIYIGTFSKAIAPSVKISYALLPPSLMKAFSERGRLYLSSVSRLEQSVVHSFMAGGSFERHLNRMRNIYRAKRQHLVSLLSQHKAVEILGENAGHHILIRISGMSENQLVSLAQAEKIKVYPVSSYFIGEVAQKYSSSVLLGYGALSEKQIEEGVSRLMKAWGV